jgi:hypothetical protein
VFHRGMVLGRCQGKMLIPHPLRQRLPKWPAECADASQR